jgi:hypothetical protein
MITSFKIVIRVLEMTSHTGIPVISYKRIIDLYGIYRYKGKWRGNGHVVLPSLHPLKLMVYPMLTWSPAESNDELQGGKSELLVGT